MLTREQLELLHQTARETMPFTLHLRHFRVAQPRKGNYAQMVALEAVFSAPPIAQMKGFWLSNLGSDVEDLEARLHDRSLPFDADTVLLPVARVALEYAVELSHVSAWSTPPTPRFSAPVLPTLLSLST
eukprot:SAG11_NODE_754_length_7332_cov_5.256325_2_plen_129_part_00